MSARNVHFGTDLRLLRKLDRRKTSRDEGSDLSFSLRPLSDKVDLDTLDGADNLAQALLLRFLTPTGDLALLGHPDYGSRLGELIGELNTVGNRNRAKLFVLQSLAAEPRVKKVLSVQVTQSRRNPVQMDIDITLLAIDSDTPLNLVFSFSLDRGITP